jgi:hypothetical protein
MRVISVNVNKLGGNVKFLGGNVKFLDDRDLDLYFGFASLATEVMTLVMEMQCWFKCWNIILGILANKTHQEFI